VSKKKKRELKKRKEAKAEWLKRLAKQHCPMHGFFRGKEIPCHKVGVTKQCAKCFEVTEGPTECVGCVPEFASKEDRLARNCPMYKKKNED